MAGPPRGLGVGRRARLRFEAFRCEAPELVHLPAATFEWYEKNYLNRDYPIRFIMRLNGVVFPDEHTIS